MYSTAIILETRTPRKDKTNPVKLRVIINRVARYYGLGVYLTETDFETAFTANPPANLKKIAIKLKAKEESAIKLLEKMEPPSFELFKQQFTKRPISGTGNVKTYYQNYISEMKGKKRLGSASNYHYSLKALSDFTDIERLNFKDITPDFLNRFSQHLTDNEKSVSTVGVFMRPLRCIYNKAQNDKIISPDVYPFGLEAEKKYQIPSSEKHKRPLERWEIERLGMYDGSPARNYYRDMFLISYFLCGINFADLLTMKWDQLNGDTITFLRSKTKTTAKKRNEIELFVNDQALEMIHKHGKPGKYIFPVLSESDTPETIHLKIKNFIRLCNQSLKKIAKEIGINNKISTVWARHSAATHSLDAGATIGAISQALGHTDLKTTSTYISSLQSGRQKLGESLRINVKTITA